MVCQHDALVPLFRAASPDDGRRQYDLVRCVACNLVTVRPLPSSEELAALYSLDYYGRSAAGGGGTGLPARWNRWFLARRCRTIQRRGERGRLLDVGCGNGEFLEAMRGRGWEVAGIEPSREARESLPAALQPLVCERIQDVRHGPFDVITLWHVLEHLPAPAEELSRLKRFLKPDGLLFLAVPNFASWEARLGRSRWFHLDVPRHVFHFTPETLAALLEATGYRITRINFFSWIYNVFGGFQTLLNLAVPERNYLYNRWKRGTDYLPRLSLGRYLVCQTVSYALAPLAVVAALALSGLAGCVGRSGTMEVEASPV